MYRIKEIQDKLLHLVGWEQAYNPAKSIDEAMTESESGLYFQGAHPLVTLDNISAIMPDDFGFIYKPWNMISVYRPGDKVKHLGVVWIALTQSQNEAPQASDFNGDFSNDFGNTYWRPYNQLSDYLEGLTRNGITKAIQEFIKMKGLNEETRNLLERKTFFDGAGRIKATITNMNKIVGFEINPVKSMGVTSKIERIGLQMTGGVGMVKVYLFHSSSIDPVKTFDLDFTITNGGFQWFNIKDCYLPNSGEAETNGSWYLCYNQSDLPNDMEAIGMAKDWSVEPCGSCNQGDIESWRQIMQYLQVSPFMTSAPTTFKEFPELRNTDKLMYTTTQNYGLNVEISVGCDLTEFIVSQRTIFQTVIQQQVAALALRTMALNPDVKVSRNQVNVSRMDVLYELDGNQQGPRPGGLGYELKRSLQVLSLDTRGLDPVCLACKSRGVRYTSI